MKILLANALFPDLGIGGSERSTYFLAKGLIDLGHDVLVFSQNVVDEAVYDVVDGVPVVRVACRPGSEPNVYSGSNYQRLAAAAFHKSRSLQKQFGEIAQSFRPDVVNTGVIGRLFSLWREAKDANAVVVHTLRGYASLCGRRMMSDGEPCRRQCRDCAATRVAARDASGVVDAVVGISHHVLDVHLRAGWFKQSSRKEVIGNSYALAHEPAASPHGDRAPYDFGYIGRLHSTKGVEVFLDALNALRASTGRPFRAVVAGTGEASYEHALRSRYEDDLTHFAGYVAPETFFTDVKFCVAPSLWYEPFGRVFVESLHHRVPVIGSRRGGGAEILENGRTGWVFEPTLEALKETMLKAASLGADDYEAMRDNAEKRAQDFRVEAIAAAYSGLYDALLRAA